MRLEFDIEKIRGNQITLIDGQIDLILDALSFYIYTYRYIYPGKKSLSGEENLRISLVRDTYCQISTQFSKSKAQNPINEVIIDSIDNSEKRKFKKVS